MARSALTSLVVTAETQAGLDGVLQGLVRDGATAAALIERSGLTLTTAGAGPAVNPAVGALVAGVFKSLRTLSGLLGEGAVRRLEQQGPLSRTLMALLDSDDLLVATFPKDQVFDAAFVAAAAGIAPLMVAAREAPSKPGLGFDAEAIEAAVEIDVLGNF